MHRAFAPEAGTWGSFHVMGRVQGAKEKRRRDQAQDGRVPIQLCPGVVPLGVPLPSPPGWFEAFGRRMVLGIALPGSGPAAEAALPSTVQTDPPASAPTSKPSTSSPPRDSLTPGPGPSSAALLRQPPAKAPTTDTISECPGTAGGCRTLLRMVPWGWGEGRQDAFSHQQSWEAHFAPSNQTY